MIRLLPLVLCLLLLQGCNWWRNMTAGDAKPGEPAELVKFEPTLKTSKAWSTGVGDGVERRAQQLRPVYKNGTLYVADHKGRLASVDASNGDKKWELKTDLPFSGGPGLSDDLVIVGTENGEVHAFVAQTGTPAWIARVSSEVLAAPVAGDNVVVVRSIDGRVFGLSLESGRRLWVYDRSVPLLTLRGNANPVVRAGVVFLGYDAGEVVALRLSDGTLMWEEAVATPEGRSELDQLADVDGQLVLVASDLLVSSYKNRVASLDSNSGRLLWFKEISSATGVVVDRTDLAISDKEGHLWLLDRRNGSTQWKVEMLENRDLTRPVIFGNLIAVGDFDGYLHLFNKADGNLVERIKVGGKGFTGAPLVVGNTLFVYTNKGKLSAYQVGASAG